MKKTYKTKKTPSGAQQWNRPGTGSVKDAPLKRNTYANLGKGVGQKKASPGRAGRMETRAWVDANIEYNKRKSKKTKGRRGRK